MGAAAASLAISQAGLSLFNGVSQSAAIRSQARYQGNIDALNAELSDMRAEDAIKRGDREAKNLKTEGKRLIGRQRASYAAQGVELGDGSPLDVQVDTAGQVAEDALTIKNNAWREAWGYRIEARNYRNSARMNDRAAKFNSKMTLLTSGLQATQFASNLFPRGR